MPIRLNLGLTKKIGEANYGSRGASVNIEAEVDSGLAMDPPRLQEKIRQLFTLVRVSLAEELNGHQQATRAGPSSTAPGTNGAAVPASPSKPPRPATQSQVKAIIAIAKSQKLLLPPLLRSHFHVERPEELTLPQASALIDELKSSPSQNGGGR